MKTLPAASVIQVALQAVLHAQRIALALFATNDGIVAVGVRHALIAPFPSDMRRADTLSFKQMSVKIIALQCSASVKAT